MILPIQMYVVSEVTQQPNPNPKHHDPEPSWVVRDTVVGRDSTAALWTLGSDVQERGTQ